jgi:cell wall-associated NlpC family hydrolase
MPKVIKILSIIIMGFFLFNCCLTLSELIAQTKKQPRISSKNIISQKGKSQRPYQPQELNATSLLPDENISGSYPIKFVSFTSELRDNIMSEIIQWYDTRYRWGGKSENGIDCSGFTSMIYEKALGIQIPRSSVEQIKIGVSVESISALQFGDLVFFKSGKRNPGHVGIYIGDGQFVHSSSYQKRGVVVSMLIESNYLKRYVGARRILNEQTTIIGG